MAPVEKRRAPGIITRREAAASMAIFLRTHHITSEAESVCLVPTVCHRRNLRNLGGTLPPIPPAPAPSSRRPRDPPPHTPFPQPSTDVRSASSRRRAGRPNSRGAHLKRWGWHNAVVATAQSVAGRGDAFAVRRNGAGAILLPFSSACNYREW